MKPDDLHAYEPQPDPQRDRDPGKPLLVDWSDSEWFQVWLKVARHESPHPA